MENNTIKKQRGRRAGTLNKIYSLPLSVLNEYLKESTLIPVGKKMCDLLESYSAGKITNISQNGEVKDNGQPSIIITDFNQETTEKDAPAI